MISREQIEANARSTAGLVSELADKNLVTIYSNIPILVMKDDKSVAPHLLREGFWESWITAWLVNNLTPDMTFVDIGANTGYYSFIAKNIGAEVFAIEANPNYASMIYASQAISKLFFDVANFAVSDKRGTVTLQIPNSLQGSATITGGINEDIYPCTHIDVSSVTLDSILPTPKGELLIKIDAEGAEELIWNGMPQILEEEKPTIMLEYTPHAYSYEFITRLSEYGDIYWINYAGNLEPVNRVWIEAQTDWVMLVVKGKR